MLLCTLLLVYSSCTAQLKTAASETKSVKLSNTWIIKAFIIDGILVYDSTKTALFTISSDEKYFTGNTGCNAMRGAVQVEPDGKIKMGPVESLRKRCVNAEAEKKFIEALECTTNYTIEGDILKLFCNDKPVALFEKTKD